MWPISLEHGWASAHRNDSLHPPASIYTLSSILEVGKMFTRRDNIQKRLVKIKKQEAKTLQTLVRQQEELEKALDENNELISAFLLKESKDEAVLRREIESLTKKRDTFQEKLDEVGTNDTFIMSLLAHCPCSFLFISYSCGGPASLRITRCGRGVSCWGRSSAWCGNRWRCAGTWPPGGTRGTAGSWGDWSTNSSHRYAFQTQPYNRRVIEHPGRMY